MKREIAATADAAHAKAGRDRLIRFGGALVAFAIVIAVVNAFSHGDFITVSNVRNVLRQITFT